MKKILSLAVAFILALPVFKAAGETVTVHVYNLQRTVEIAEPFKASFSKDGNGIYTLANLFGGDGEIKFSADYDYGNKGTEFDINIKNPVEGNGEGGMVFLAGNDDGYVTVEPKPIDGLIKTPLVYFAVNTIESRICINDAEKGNSCEIRVSGYNGDYVRFYLVFEYVDAKPSNDKPVDVHVYNLQRTVEIAEPFKASFSKDENGIYTLANLFGGDGEIKFSADYDYGNKGTEFDINIKNPVEGNGEGGMVFLVGNDDGYMTVEPKPIDGLIKTPLMYFAVNTIESRICINDAEKGNSCEIRVSGYNGDYIRFYLVFEYEALQGGVEGIEIDSVIDENAPIEYYNLQGIRVENPTTGLYIKRQGNKVEKVIIR